MRDVAIIGAGLTGLTAILCLAHGGAKVTLITKGIGDLQLSQDTIDLLGYSDSGRITQSLVEVETYVASRPGHPYSHLTPEFIVESANWLEGVLGPKLPVDDPRQNVIIPTSPGALCSTNPYQPSMAAGILTTGKSYVIVGLKRLKDFYPKIIAENLSHQATADGVPIQVRSPIVDAEIREDEVDTAGTNHARTLDNTAMRKRLVAAIALHLREGGVVGLPAVLGLNDLGAWKDIGKRLGHEVFGIAMRPPLIPGMRLNRELIALVRAQARLIIDSHVTGVETKDGVVTAVSTSTAGCSTRIETKNVVLAGGDFESGALDMDSYGVVADSILGLPTLGTEDQLPHGGFWGYEQPVFLADSDVDDAVHPLNANKKPVYSNVYAADGNLAGTIRWRERSGEGIAFTSALHVADQILGSLK